MQDKPQNLLVQERIKKMLENRKKNLKKEVPEESKRMKSHIGDIEPSLPQVSQEQKKPQSSLRRRRPSSSIKPSQTTNSITTTSSAKSDVDVRPYILQVFQHGHKLKDYLHEKKIEKESCQQKILENELFFLSLMSKLKQFPQQLHLQMVQKQLISKIQKIQMIEAQNKKCQQVEDKIHKIIEQRLKALRKY